MKSVNEFIERTRIWVESQLKEIRDMKYEKHRLILICSLVDSFAQYVAGYNLQANAKHFSDFVLRYSSVYTECLEAVCPATMFYDCQDRWPNEEELKLPSDMIIYVDGEKNKAESDRLLSMLPEKDRDKIREKHQYARLIYAMRNKLVHEMILIGCPVDFITEDSDPIPHMVMEYSMNTGEKHWTLRMSERFVFEVAENAIMNYLAECEQNGVMPLSMEIKKRKCYYAWYDR